VEPLELSAEEYSVFFQWCHSLRLGWPTGSAAVRERLDAIAALPNVKTKMYPNAISYDRLFSVYRELGFKALSPEKFQEKAGASHHDFLRSPRPRGGPTGKASKGPLFVGDLPPVAAIIGFIRAMIDAGGGYAIVRTPEGRVRFERGPGLPAPE
jgi:hypothetical protein